jgi:hypothetical protein
VVSAADAFLFLGLRFFSSCFPFAYWHFSCKEYKYFRHLSVPDNPATSPLIRVALPGQKDSSIYRTKIYICPSKFLYLG